MTNDNRSAIRPAITPDALTEASAYAREVFRRWPVGGAWLQGDADADDPALPPESRLRRLRQLEGLRIQWRELAGQHDVEHTGRALSRLAERCLELALAEAEQRVAERHGALHDADGRPARMAVLALGKLGGDELNFNSDLDLVFCHRASGESDGRRPLEPAAYLARVVRELTGLMEEVRAEGRAWVIDTRLRPFGQAGALVWSIDAMEQYFINEGRAWERYAWLKARPVAGDRALGTELLERIAPFVFRRYLDYGLFDSLRALHAEIDDRSRRLELEDDIKRGSGGIRELEFIVQSIQLLRGGREPGLRVPGFLPALAGAVDAGLLADAAARPLADDYRFLRALENRIQLVTGRQTHELPGDPTQRTALADLCNADGWPALATRVDAVRRRVRSAFRQQFEAGDKTRATPDEPIAWPPGEDCAEHLAAVGFEDPEDTAALLARLETRIARRPLSAEGRRRLERLMPELLAEVAHHRPPDTGLSDLLRLIETVARRSAYLALLHERPQTLKRCIDVFRASSRLAEWVIESPQLLDDLLAPDSDPRPPRLGALDADDPEASLLALARYRQAGFLRTALGQLDGRIDRASARVRLTRLAETVLEAIAKLYLPGGGIAVIGYGNLGAAELHYTSDLDLVFLHGGGDAPLRGVQRMISAMQLPQPGGRLYAIDTRLRPNGNAGMLVSTSDSFDDYQCRHAWLWEHQALIRARCVTGPADLCRRFERTRDEVLARERDPGEVRATLAEMRARQLRERSEGDEKRLLGDIQFIAELGILCCAHEHRELIEQRSTPGQLAALASAGWIAQADADRLIEAFDRIAELRDRRFFERIAPEPPAGDDRALVAAAWREHFGAPPDAARRS